eukprot:scaffold52512_cov27-Tisochrysis_lutea.AAC.2
MGSFLLPPLPTERLAAAAKAAIGSVSSLPGRTSAEAHPGMRPLPLPAPPKSECRLAPTSLLEGMPVSLPVPCRRFWSCEESGSGALLRGAPPSPASELMLPPLASCASRSAPGVMWPPSPSRVEPLVASVVASD